MAPWSLLLAIVVALPAGAALCRAVSRTPTRSARTSRQGHDRRQERAGDAALDRRPRPRHRRRSARPGLRRLSARRRQPGPRRRGPAALRRPQLADDRRRRHRASVWRWPASSGSSPAIFGGIVDWVAVALARRAVGVPDLPAGDLALHRADQQGHRHRPDLDHRRQPVAADLHHRHRLRALCRAADPRPGAVVEAERVRAGRRRPRRAGPAHPRCATSCPT